MNQRRKKESSILLREHFFKSQIVYTPGNVDKFLIGLATQPMQEFDNYFTEEVTKNNSYLLNCSLKSDETFLEMSGMVIFTMFIFHILVN